MKVTAEQIRDEVELHLRRSSKIVGLTTIYPDSPHVVVVQTGYSDEDPDGRVFEIVVTDVTMED